MTEWRVGGEGQEEEPEEPEAEEARTGRTDASTGVADNTSAAIIIKMFNTNEPDHVKSVNGDNGWEEIGFALDSEATETDTVMGEKTC